MLSGCRPWEAIDSRELKKFYSVSYNGASSQLRDRIMATLVYEGYNIDHANSDHEFVVTLWRNIEPLKHGIGFIKSWERQRKIQIWLLEMNVEPNFRLRIDLFERERRNTNDKWKKIEIDDEIEDSIKNEIFNSIIKTIYGK